jgi:hypothetical protein
MSVRSPQGRTIHDEKAESWIVFAAVLLLTVGALNVIDGIAAISKSHFYVAGAHYIFGDLKMWGWIVLILGITQLLVGYGLFSRNQLARWTGVVIVGLNAIAQLLMIPAYPFWSLALFALDIVALYALVAYGDRAMRA